MTPKGFGLISSFYAHFFIWANFSFTNFYIIALLLRYLVAFFLKVLRLRS